MHGRRRDPRPERSPAEGLPAPVPLGRRLPALFFGGSVIAVLAGVAWLALARPTRPPAPAPAGPDTSGAAGAAPASAPPVPAPTPEVERLRMEVLATHPHDATAYTQGLVVDGGRLYESTGLYGSSTLRQVEKESGKVLRRLQVPSAYFGEGLALVKGKLLQLTWREGKAFVYDAASFKKEAELDYAGEGWGLCYDGRRLVMSDGSAQLTFRDPATLATTGQVQVALDSQPVPQLNELECVDGAVYANVYQTDQIVRIDPASGRVTAVIDGTGLLSEREARMSEVLNGIAYDPAKKVFLITGKLWPKLFEVRFVKP